jgi:hypothetical protein
MKRSNVDHCSIAQWLSIEPLRKLTFPTEVLPVPEEFVSYLLDDGGIFMSEDRFPVVKQTDLDYDEDPDQLERWTKKRRSHLETLSNEEDEGSCPIPFSSLLRHPLLHLRC